MAIATSTALLIGAGVAAFGFRRNMNEKEVTEIGVKK